MTCCGVKIQARRNGDLRITYTPSSRRFTFSGLVATLTIRDGETVLLQVTESATANGSNIGVVGDSFVLSLMKEDIALLDAADPDTTSDILSYDLVATDETGFDNWLFGGPFIVLGLNDQSCGDSCGEVEVSLNGQCVEISIEGGNLSVGASAAYEELRVAVGEAQEAAEQAEIAAAQAIAATASKMDKAASLSDVADVGDARDNIDVPSRSGEGVNPAAFRAALEFELTPDEISLATRLTADLIWETPYWEINRGGVRPLNAVQGIAVDPVRGYFYDMCQGAFGGVDKTVVTRYPLGTVPGVLTGAAAMTESELLGHQGMAVESATGKLVMTGPNTDATEVIRLSFVSGGPPTGIETYRLAAPGTGGGNATCSLNYEGTEMVARIAQPGNMQVVRVYDWTAMVAEGPGDYSARTDVILSEFTIPNGSSISFFTQGMALSDNLVYHYAGYTAAYGAIAMTAYSKDGSRHPVQNANFLLGQNEAFSWPDTWEPEAICATKENGKLVFYVGITFGPSGTRKSFIYKFGDEVRTNALPPSNSRALITTRGFLVRGHPIALPNPYSGRAGLQNHGISWGGSGAHLGYWSTAAGEKAHIIMSKSKSGVIGDVTGAVGNGDDLGALQFEGSDGTNLVTCASIVVEATGAASAGSVPTRQLFYTMSAAGNLNLAFEIDSDTRKNFRRPNNGDYARFLRAGAIQGGIYAGTSSFSIGGRNGVQTSINIAPGDDLGGGVSWVLNHPNGSWYPSADNAQQLGGASNRPSVIYAATGTINTSDAREKALRGGENIDAGFAVSPMSPEEIEWAKLLSREVGFYKWRVAIEKKGDDARVHVGLTVQRAIEIGEGLGLSPMTYGFICYDEWEDIRHPDTQELEIPAGNRYSFRMDELSLFIARGMDERLSSLEEAQ